MIHVQLRKLFFILIALSFGFCQTITAETVRVYCQTQTWWSKDGAAVGIYYWGDGIAKMNWPGVRITKVEGSNDIWYADIEKSANFIFTRINGEGTIEDWKAKTPDLTFPTDGNNLYVIGSSEKWNEACSGQWSKYASGLSAWAVVGTFNDWSSAQTMRSHLGGESFFDSVYLEAGREYEFKIRETQSNTWYGNAGLMTQAHCSDWVFNTEAGNCTLASTVAGWYVFTWTPASSLLTVTYPAHFHQATLYNSPVRDNNPDVMLQAFYWAHVGSTAEEFNDFGNVHWSALKEEADTLAKYFDMVWLAPSQETADYTGYLPINYSHQGITTKGNSPWGNSTDLRNLIDRLHKGGAKVIADIVINHSSAAHADEYVGSNPNWCHWETMDFGRYGVYTPDYTWLAKGDEIFYAKQQQAGDCGLLDNSDNETDEWEYTYKGGIGYWEESEFNCMYSRDWAHKKREVREMSRAYLTWMRDSMGYDGWRYDFVKGLHGSHIFDYNRTSGAYFSVCEVFDGDIDKQLGVLQDTYHSTYMFDFPGKFTIYNEAIRPYKLENLKGNYYTLIGCNEGAYKKYAVTFIDNHDSFREEGKSLNYWPNTIDDRQAQQAICYLFSMPGVPCLVYPYWNNYKDLVKKVIRARKAVGVHSQSVVEGDWAACENENDRNNNTYYTAKIRGDKGYLFLKLGKKSAPLMEPEAGYRLAWGSDEAAVWYKTDNDVPTDADTMVDEETKTQKIFENGQLYIVRQGVKYTINGWRCQ